MSRKVLEYFKWVGKCWNIWWIELGIVAGCTFCGTERDFFRCLVNRAPLSLESVFGFRFTRCSFLWNSRRSANLFISCLREDFLAFVPPNSDPWIDFMFLFLLIFLLFWPGNFCSSWNSFSRFEIGLCTFCLTASKIYPPSSPVLAISFSELSSNSFHSSSSTTSLCPSKPATSRRSKLISILFLEQKQMHFTRNMYSIQGFLKWQQVSFWRHLYLLNKKIRWRSIGKVLSNHMFWPLNCKTLPNIFRELILREAGSDCTPRTGCGRKTLQWWGEQTITQSPSKPWSLVIGGCRSQAEQTPDYREPQFPRAFFK